MSARAPAAIYALWSAIDHAIPRAQLGGIVGDTAHSFGYHLARRDLPASDYSTQLRADRLGAADCAAALDVTLPADLMKTCTKRLVVAAKARDPRLRALREFCGTLDGSHTYPWDLSTNSSEGVDTWDGSHLWHIHLSFYREFADDAAALAPIADVLAGVSTTSDPLEEIMAMYADKADFEKALRGIVHDELSKQTRNELLPADAPADDKTKGPHRVETYLNGIPGYVEYSKR
jgi:hypothetical protein